MKIEGSRSASGSISQRHGSADPDLDSGSTPKCHGSATLETGDFRKFTNLNDSRRVGTVNFLVVSVLIFILASAYSRKLKVLLNSTGSVFIKQFCSLYEVILNR